MQKIVGVSLSVLMSLSLLGCSASKKVSDPVSITVWHYYNNAQLESFQKAIEEFNSTIGKQENIIVSEKSLGYVTDLASALVNSAENIPGSDPMPDMFMAYADTAYQLDHLGVVAELDDYFTQDELDAFYQCFLEEGRIGEDGALKIVPVAKSVEALYINTTDFEKFMDAHPEITYEDLNTIEGIIETAKVYYDYSGGKSFYGRDSISNYFVIGARQLGIDLMTYDENGSFKFNADERVMRKLYDSYYVPLVSGYFSANGKFRSSDMQTGDVLCYTGSTSSAFYFPEKVIVNDNEEYEIECKVMMPPSFKDAQVNYTVSQGAGFVVAKGEESKEEACVKFLKWFTEGENSKDFSSGAGYLPVRNDQLNESLYSDITNEAEKQSFIVGLQILDNNHSYTNVPSVYGTSIRSVLDVTLNELAAKNMEQIATLEAQGYSHFDAVAQMTSDEVFEGWLNDLKAQVEEICHQQ